MSTSFSEALEINFDLSSSIESSVEGDMDIQVVSSFEKTHCDDCKNDGCSDADDCCQSACSCGSSYLLGSSGVSHIAPSNSSKIRWYFYSSYRLPFLDPALKPPLFS